MSFSGYFAATSAPPDWQAYPTLARICEAAELTNRQAEVVLLYCARQRGPTEIGRILRLPRQEVRRSLLAANRHLQRQFPRLRELLERVRGCQSQDSYLVLSCLRNVVSTGRSPVYEYDENGRQVTVRATVMAVPQHRFEALDVLEYLLAQGTEEEIVANS